MTLEVWVEKYRPKTLKEMINQKHIVDRLKAFVKNKSIPHMIFAGPPGTGKTASAIALARDFYGKNWHQNFQETNASVTPDTPIMIRKKGKIKRTTFGDLADEYFSNNNSRYVRPKDLEVLSTDENYNIEFLPVSLISRHKIKKIAEIKFEGGSIKTSLNHSVIVLDKDCNLISKKVSELEKKDLLITFKTMIDGKNIILDFDSYKPELYIKITDRLIRNPKIKTILENIELTPELSWLFGLYLAEGCINFRDNTNGLTIFSLGYPDELPIAEQVDRIIKNNFGLKTTLFTSGSGFDRKRKSSIQIRTYNTQLARFFSDNFYNGYEEESALTKRTPPFVFNSLIEKRLEFLKGYMGDSTGKWKGYLRYSSVSNENLIDIAWLARVSGLDSSCFKGEARIIWKLPSYSYIKTEFIPSEPLINFMKKITKKTKFNWRYHLRHQLYWKKSKRITKELAKNLLEKINEKILDLNEKTKYEKLLKLVDSDLSFVQIKSIKIKEYNDFVYDFSVPNTEMFWGGTTPILLHNSDERGINVVRTRIKDFARIKPLNAPFKIVFLDESDALTSDAQQALRRTIEQYSDVCRFILSCNYSSRIITPIQSRCTLFRFRPLSKEDVFTYLDRIITGEKLDVDKKALEAIFTLSEGDLRKAVNILQASSSLGKKITEDVVYEVASQAKPKDVKEMLEFVLKGDFKSGRKKLHDLILKQGLAAEDVIKACHREIFDLNIPEEMKVELINKLGEYDFRISEGGDPLIQIEAFLANFLLMRGKE